MDNMIDVDFTIVIQFVNFVVTIVVLNFLLIKPVREQIQTRQSLLAGYAAEVERFTLDADQKITSYEAALAKARAEASKEREVIRGEAQSIEQDILGKAQADAQSYLQSSREQVAKESQAAIKILLGQVNDFAAKAVAKVLG